MWTVIIHQPQSAFAGHFNHGHATVGRARPGQDQRLVFEAGFQGKLLGITLSLRSKKGIEELLRSRGSKQAFGVG